MHSSLSTYYVPALSSKPYKPPPTQVTSILCYSSGGPDAGQWHTRARSHTGQARLTWHSCSPLPMWSPSRGTSLLASWRQSTAGFSASFSRPFPSNRSGNSHRPRWKGHCVGGLAPSPSPWQKAPRGAQDRLGSYWNPDSGGGPTWEGPLGRAQGTIPGCCCLHFSHLNLDPWTLRSCRHSHSVYRQRRCVVTCQVPIKGKR
jgi:hypothetical protein